MAFLSRSWLLAQFVLWRKHSTLCQMRVSIRMAHRWAHGGYDRLACLNHPIQAATHFFSLLYPSYSFSSSAGSTAPVNVAITNLSPLSDGVNLALIVAACWSGWIRVHKLTAYRRDTQTWQSRVMANHSKLYPLHGAIPVQPWPYL